MIANCQGCQAELDALYEFAEQGLHFCGEGFNEKGHLTIRFVNDKGEVIVK